MSLYDIVVYTLLGNFIDFIPNLIKIFFSILGFNTIKLDSNISHAQTKKLYKYITDNGYYYSKGIIDSEIVPACTLFIVFKPFSIGWINLTNDTNHRGNKIHKEITTIIKQKNLDKLITIKVEEKNENVNITIHIHKEE